MWQFLQAQFALKKYEKEISRLLQFTLFNCIVLSSVFPREATSENKW